MANESPETVPSEETPAPASSSSPQVVNSSVASVQQVSSETRSATHQTQSSRPETVRSSSDDHAVRALPAIFDIASRNVYAELVKRSAGTRDIGFPM